MQSIRISILICFFYTLFSLSIAELIEDDSGCWIDCDVKINYDSLFVKSDSVFAVLQIENLSSDTFLLDEILEVGHSYSNSEIMLAVDSLGNQYAGGAGGTSMRLNKDKCVHWSIKEGKNYKSNLGQVDWKILEPRKKVQMMAYICKYNETEIISDISITKSFIYRYNSLLDNYHVCNRDKVTFPVTLTLMKNE